MRFLAFLMILAIISLIILGEPAMQFLFYICDHKNSMKMMSKFL